MKNSLKKNQIAWIRSDPFTRCHIGFCPSKKAWEEVSQWSNMKYPHTKKGASMAQCFEWHTKDVLRDYSRVFLITCSDELDNSDAVNQAGVIAHECMHVLQGIKEYIDEHKPSDEFEAYYFENLFTQIYEAYLNTRIA